MRFLSFFPQPRQTSNGGAVLCKSACTYGSGRLRIETELGREGKIGTREGGNDGCVVWGVAVTAETDWLAGWWDDGLGLIYESENWGVGDGVVGCSGFLLISCLAQAVYMRSMP